MPRKPLSGHQAPRKWLSRHGTRRTEPLEPSLRNLIDIARSAEVTVIVDAIETAGDAEWWRLAGADIGIGGYLG